MNSMLELAEQSASTDLAFLLRAKEEAKKRMKDNPGPENIRAFKAARDAVGAETTRLASPNPVRVYKTQLDAVGYLNNAGYKIAKSKFNRDVNERKVPTNKDGHFEESALLGYAGVNLSATGQLADRATGEATLERLSADAELKKIQAQRQQLKLEKEQGQLMPRAEHERELGARARFFKAEVRNFIKLHGAAMIHLVGGQEEKLPDLFRFWDEATANWMDAWAQDRQFVVDDGEPEEEGAEE
jgi:hypothetical protein